VSEYLRKKRGGRETRVRAKNERERAGVQSGCRQRDDVTLQRMRDEGSLPSSASLMPASS
jgi:hypothetical protein